MHIRYAISAILAFVAFSAMAEERESKAILDELNAAPKAKIQSDLDTTQLASAHRERASSAAEKTDGLWQSWVVAICQGCGVRERQHSQKDTDELLGRAAARLEQKPATAIGLAKMPVAPRVIRPMDALEGRGPGLTTGSISQPSGTTSGE